MSICHNDTDSLTGSNNSKVTPSSEDFSHVVATGRSFDGGTNNLLQHRCSICRRSFLLASELKEHQKLHVGKSLFGCKFCDAQFLTVSRLTEHFKMHKKTARSAKEKSFSCDTCGRSFSRMSNLTVHKRLHSNLTAASCDKCELAFSRPTDLLRHKRMHGETRSSVSSKRIKTPTETAASNCLTSPLVSLTVRNVVHAKRSDDSEIGLAVQAVLVSGSRSAAPDSSLDSSQSHVKRLVCHYCQRPFQDTLALRLHVQTHTGSKPFACQFCERVFAKAYDMRRHVMIIHTREKPYTCDLCGRSFALGHALKQHKRVHTGEKPFYCEQCGLNFSSSSQLSQHKKIHSGNVHDCEICGRSFLHACLFAEHMRRHAGEKPHCCGTCGVWFSTLSDLTNHVLLSHSKDKPPHPCDKCECSFVSASALSAHKAFHSTAEPLPSFEQITDRSFIKSSCGREAAS